MAETDILVTRETKRSFGLVRGAMAILMLGLPFLGRQRVRVTSERIIVEQGFWTKTRDDVEVFRIRDVVSKQAFWHRLVGIGDVLIKATEGRTERPMCCAACPTRSRSARRSVPPGTPAPAPANPPTSTDQPGAKAGTRGGGRLTPDPIDRNLRPPEAGGRPNGRRAKWRVAKPADAGAGD
jgi:hypothetical protein